MLVLTNHLRLSREQERLVRALCHASKNLYNLGLFNTRQFFFHDNELLRYVDDYPLAKSNENYKLMQAASAQQTLRIVERNMSSFLEVNELYGKGELKNRPGLPRYLDKEGLFVVVFPRNAFSMKDGMLRLGISREFGKQYPEAHKMLRFRLPEPLLSKVDAIQEIQILPSYDGRYYKICYIYQEKMETKPLNQTKYLSIDLGIDNFATIVDTAGTTQLICGRFIKSINRWYNKENARLQSIKDKQRIECLTNRQCQLLVRRNNLINEFMNRAVDHIVRHCLDDEIGNVVVGELKEIKQRIDHGRVNNQNFVQIPYARFKQKLRSKCRQFGIVFLEIDEAFTSRTDALALDEIKSQPYGQSRRVKRGLFQSRVGVLLNADVVGAINIMRKVAGDSCVSGIVSSGLVNRPQRIRLAYEANNLLSDQIATVAA